MNGWAALTGNWRRGAVGAAGSVLLGSFLLLTPLGDGLSHLSYDLPFALRPDVPTDEVVMVLMDEDSYSRLEQPIQGPWNRALHIQLLKTLTARSAKAVVFDFLWDKPWTNQTVDTQLAETIKVHGRVVLAASAHYSNAQDQPSIGRLFRAAEPIGSSAPSGIVELPIDTDGVIRRHGYHPRYPTLAQQTAGLLGKAPPVPTRQRWMNFYGPPGTVAKVSYSQILGTNELSAGVFDGKVVFVGQGPIVTYQGSHVSDEYRTPYTRWTGRLSTGVELQATAALNLWRGDWLTRFPSFVELGSLLFAGIGFGFALVFFRPVPALVLSLVGILATAVLACLLVWHRHCWFAWMILSGAQIPTALGWSILSYPSRSARKMAPRTAEGHPPEVPDHTVLSCIGQGSYGKVWLARNVMGIYRAVKIVSRQSFTDKTPYEREFRGIMNFEPISRSHPGLVNILHVGRNDATGWFYYIMEAADDLAGGQPINPSNYVPKTLAALVAKDGRPPVSECLQIGLALTEALDHLHQHKLVHRDIKPANVVFIAGNPKLADIGLVAAAGEAPSFVGTKGFIPPEGPGTAQADIYSLGMVLYELSMGRDRLCYPELPTSLDEDPDLDLLLKLNDVILKACETNLVKRYQSARKFHEALQKIAKQMTADKTNKRRS